MIYFLSIYSAAAALSFTDFSPKLRRAGAFFCIILLSMLAGWRNMGGSDFYIYQDIYYGLALNYMSSEAGYALLNNLFSFLGFSFNAFLFVYSLLSVTALITFLEKHVKFPKFALLFYMACYFFFYNMVLNRQMFCMSLALWVVYFWDKNKILSLLLLFAGVLFHQSIIVFLPFLLVYEVLKRTKGVKCWAAFFILFIAATAGLSPMRFLNILSFVPGLSFISVRTLGYLENASGAYSLNAVEYVKMAAALMIILPFIKKLWTARENRIWLFLYFSGVILLFWTRNVEILFRIFVYFDLSLLVLLPLAINLFLAKFPPAQRRPLLILIYAAVGALAVGAILYRTAKFGDGAFWAYQFYFLEV